MKIISAEERLKQQTGVEMSIFGQYGVGKTSLLKTMALDHHHGGGVWCKA